MAKSHKTCMEQSEIIDMFGTYHYCVAISHRLLDDEIGVPIDYEASGSACFVHADAMEERLVLYFVVGGVAEVDLKDIL